MIGDLTNGRAASDIFRELMQSNKSLTPQEVTRMVAGEFPKIDGAAIQFMRRWQGFGHRDNIQDDVLDLGVKQFLMDAGYKVAAA